MDFLESEFKPSWSRFFCCFFSLVPIVVIRNRGPGFYSRQYGSPIYIISCPKDEVPQQQIQEDDQRKEKVKEENNKVREKAVKKETWPPKPEERQSTTIVKVPILMLACFLLTPAANSKKNQKLYKCPMETCYKKPSLKNLNEHLTKMHKVTSAVRRSLLV